MKYKLQDLMDIEQFQMLQDRLNEIYSFPSAIIDNDGNVLTATAWQDICTQFHRKNPACERDCIQSDQYILSHLAEANPAVTYRCPRGLVDNATPIIIDGVHYGNFFTGQFFLEPPNLQFFEQQAERYGFDKEAYLDAVRRVPVWSQAQLNSYLFFIKGLIEVISSIGLKNLREAEARQKVEEAETRADTILRQMLDAFWVVDLHGNILDVNPAMCQLTGYTRDELLAMTISQVDANDSPEIVAHRIEQVVQNGSGYFESRFRRKDGRIVNVDISVNYLSDRGVFFGFHRDITERKRAEEALRQRERDFSTLVENASDMVVRFDTAKRHVYCNPAVLRQFNRPMSAFLGKKPLDLESDPRALAFIDQALDLALATAQEQVVEQNMSTPIGVRYFQTRIVPEMGSNGQIESLLAVTRDISELKQAEETLRTTTAQLETLIRVSPLAIFVLDTAGLVNLWNPAAEKIFGWTADETVGLPNPIVPPASREEYVRWSNQVLGGHPIINQEAVRQRKDGSLVNVTISSAPLFDAEGRLSGRMAIIVDDTERKRTEQLIAQEEFYLKKAQEMGKLGHFSYDPVSSQVEGSAELFRIFDVDPSLPLFQAFANGVHPEDGHLIFPYIDLAIQKGIPYAVEHRVRHRDGTVLYVHARGEIVHLPYGRKMIGIVQDITERKQMEKALQESEDKYRKLFAEMASGCSLQEIICDSAGQAVDYVTLDVNNAFEVLLNVPRAAVIGKRASEILPPEELTHWLKIFGPVALTGQSTHYEMYSPFNQKQFEGIVFCPEKGKFAAVFSDVTIRKHAESERAVTLELLNLLTQPNDIQYLLRETTSLLRNWSGCEAVGIRFRQGDDFPYFETQGFPAKFVQLENRLCALDQKGELVRDSKGDPVLECMCGNVICGRFDPYLPFFTENGSFWSNCTTELLASTTEGDRQTNTRNRCNGMGYESVALIPLRYGSRNLGLLQFNDHRRDRFDKDKIALFERLASSLALGLTQRQTAEALRQSEAKFRAVVENSSDGILFGNVNAEISYRSPSYQRINGYSNEERLGRSGFETVHADDMDGLHQYWAKVVQSPGVPLKTEYRIRHKDGTWRWVETTSQNLIDNPDVQEIVVTTHDITERKQSEEQIKKALAEKETLLRELYHRTKNNMSVINALLSLQASYFNDENLQKAFEVAQDRIRAMALVHQKLYETSDLSHINLKDYIQDLIQLIRSSHFITPSQVAITAEMSDVFVLIDTAIPCGLILNELISNALKYAFSDGRLGQIRVQLSQAEDGEIKFTISDNGVGIPGTFNPRNDGHMGLQTVFALVENQLQGRITYQSEGGVSWMVQFKDDLYQPRV
jgi:PAS domain S-box-containing protein